MRLQLGRADIFVIDINADTRINLDADGMDGDKVRIHCHTVVEQNSLL